MAEPNLGPVVIIYTNPDSGREEEEFAPNNGGLDGILQVIGIENVRVFYRGKYVQADDKNTKLVTYGEPITIEGVRAHLAERWE